MPTSNGIVAPARFTTFKQIIGRIFDGEDVFFMSQVYFRQEVLQKYEASSDYEVADNGSVSCHNYWSLNRSTIRLGNELISTAIGDFAEAIPFEEWPHWKQFVVEPPSQEQVISLQSEQTIPDQVNNLVYSLNTLNNSIKKLSVTFGYEIRTDIWNGTVDSLAGRQLKWVYPTSKMIGTPPALLSQVVANTTTSAAVSNNSNSGSQTKKSLPVTQPPIIKKPITITWEEI